MTPRLVLLPGMDGTGDLFADFIRALPSGIEAQVVRYPVNRCLSNLEIVELVHTACGNCGSFVLLAESFSTPLAIQLAAEKPSNLKGLVLCAGFVASPVRGWRRLLGSLAAPVLFFRPPSEFVTRRLLVGRSASEGLVVAVQAAIATVQPTVLSDRFRRVLTCDVRADTSKVEVPILYLRAAQDRLISAACAEVIRRIQPQVVVETLGGPHLLIQREPQLTADAVARFLFLLS